MTKIRVTKAFNYEGEEYEPGEVVDLPESAAESVEEKGFGTQMLEEAEPEIKPVMTDEPEGVNVENMLPGGLFIGPDDVLEGDAVKIQEPGRVDDSFDQERLVLPVVFEGEEKRVSLGPENIERISDVYGMNTKSWVGKAIQVDSIEEYAGIDKKGIVWKPATGEA